MCKIYTKSGYISKIWCYNVVKFMGAEMNFNQLLKDKGLTQYSVLMDLETRFNCKKTQTLLSKYLSGKTLPNIEIAYYLAQILNVDLQEFIEGIMENKL